MQRKWCLIHMHLLVNNNYAAILLADTDNSDISVVIIINIAVIILLSRTCSAGSSAQHIKHTLSPCSTSLRTSSTYKFKQYRGQEQSKHSTVGSLEAFIGLGRICFTARAKLSTVVIHTSSYTFHIISYICIYHICIKTYTASHK